MRILGLSAFQRDAAAALLVDGEVVAAAQEERFTRRALDPAFPRRAIRACLAAARLNGAQLDRAVFYEKPVRKFERVLVRSLRGFPGSAGTFARSAFLWLGERLWVRNRIARELGLEPQNVLFVEQPRAQLAHAFLSSPFDEAALLLLDDVCEGSSTVLARGRGSEVELLYEVRHPHSLGLFVSALTQYLGFTPGEDEHKLEALAAHGTPKRTAELAGLLRTSEAFFELAEAPFAFDDGADRLFTPELERLLGPARRAGETLRATPADPAHADLAASVQALVEERALALAHELARRTGSANLCLAGLLAENRALVARLASEAPFQNVFVPAAPGKAGGALGAAWCAHLALGGARRGTNGRACAPLEAIDERAEPGARELANRAEALDQLGARLERDELVGWARGALEFGRLSLGNRVALARASGSDARRRLLAALGHTEDFLPCRVALAAGRAQEYVDVPVGLVAAAHGACTLVHARPSLHAHAPSALLPDGRVWAQLVEPGTDPELHELLLRLERSGGAPLVLLTDLAPRGSPLARDEADAVEIFGRSGLDALVAGTRLYLRA